MSCCFKRYGIVRHVATLLLGLCHYFSSGQQSEWQIQKFSFEQGLSKGYVYTMHQDRNGFIWAGTDGGLNRFDGYEFKVFRNKPFDTSSLGDNAVYFIIEDTANHKLWIGTRTCLNYFDTRTHKVVRYYNTETSNELSDGKALNEFEWLLTYNTEVYHFDLRTKRFSKVPIYDGEKLVADIDLIENICVDKQRNFLIVGNKGLFAYDSIQRRCVRKPGKPDLKYLEEKTILYCLQDSNGDYWFATIADGVIKYTTDNQEYRKVQLPGSEAEKNIRFDFILEDSQRNIWIAGSAGLFLIDKGYGQITRFLYDARRTDGISHKEINCLLEDKNHGVWVGTAGGGINFFYQQNYKFHNISLVNNDDEQLSPYVMSLNKGFNDEIWYWCLNGNYGAFLPDWRQRKKRLPVDESKNFRFVNDGSIERSNIDTLIFLNGVASLKLFGKSRSGKASLFDNREGICNVATLRSGQTIWFVTKKTMAPQLIGDTFYLDSYVYDFKEDSHGHYWLCGPSGLLWYEPATRKYNKYRHDHRDSLSLSSNIIYDFEFDEVENIWIASMSGGLNYFDRSTASFRHYSTSEGLQDDITYAMEKDVNGNLWLSTNHGLSRFNSRTKTFRNFTSKDGLLNMEFNRQASYKNEKGQLFFGGVLGIDFFDPLEITDVKANHILSFTGFSLFNKDLYPDQWDGEVPLFRLKHDQNYITIRFSAMNFKDAARVQYAYRLNDNNEWMSLGNSHSLLLTNLSPGTHVFHFRSTNVNGEWSNVMKSCRVIISPPWWQRWWFRLFVTAVVLLGVGALFRIRIQQEKRRSFLRHQFQELEMKALKSQMNPHFVYNAMNSIQALVLAKKTQEASLYISKFGRLLRQVLDNSEKTVISLDNEFQSLELYIQLEQLRLNVDLRYKILIDANVNAEEEFLPPLIFQPFVENALWHGLSNKDGEKNLSISIHVIDDWLVATIEDNGIGRMKAIALNSTKHALRKSKGIEITTKRLTEYNKTTGINAVHVNDIYNDGKAAGTRVVVKIKRFATSTFHPRI